jgi:uncharacterized protein (DUF433 family)
MAEHPRISLAPDTLAGKPVIRGTRLSVEFVIGLMAGGWTEADIIGNYPGVTHEDILACPAYARDTLSVEKVFPSAANENVPGNAVSALAAAGHDVVWRSRQRDGAVTNLRRHPAAHAHALPEHLPRPTVLRWRHADEGPSTLANWRSVVSFRPRD